MDAAIADSDPLTSFILRTYQHLYHCAFTTPTASSTVSSGCSDFYPPPSASLALVSAVVAEDSRARKGRYEQDGDYQPKRASTSKKKSTRTSAPSTGPKSKKTKVTGEERSETPAKSTKAGTTDPSNVRVSPETETVEPPNRPRKSKPTNQESQATLQDSDHAGDNSPSGEDEDDPPLQFDNDSYTGGESSADEDSHHNHENSEVFGTDLAAEEQDLLAKLKNQGGDTQILEEVHNFYQNKMTKHGTRGSKIKEQEMHIAELQAKIAVLEQQNAQGNAQGEAAQPAEPARVPVDLPPLQVDYATVNLLPIDNPQASRAIHTLCRSKTARKGWRTEKMLLENAHIVEFALEMLDAIGLE